MDKRLALTNDGHLTYCTASEENIGKGRCNHCAHQNKGESMEEFMTRANQEHIKSSSLYKSFEKYNEQAKQRRERILNVLNDEQPKEETIIAILKAEENLTKEQKSLFNADLVLSKFIEIQENGTEDQKEFIEDDIQEFKQSMKLIIEYGSFIMNWDDNAKKLEANSNDTRDYKMKLTEMDHARRSKHNAAIACISMMNKICDSYEIEHFYDGKIGEDSETREEIGNNILQMISNRSEYLCYL